MALTLPFINTIPAFDVNKGINISLNVKGGQAISGYTFNIYSNDGSNTPIYSSPNFDTGDIASESIRSFPIQLNASMGIYNNNKYKIEPITYTKDDAGNIINSITGMATLFVCYKEPSIEFYHYAVVDKQAGFVKLKNDETLQYSKPTIKIVFDPIDFARSAKPNIAEIYVYGVKRNGDKNLLYSDNEIYDFKYDVATNKYFIELEISGFSINVDKDGNVLGEVPYENFSLSYNLSTIENMQISGDFSGLNCYYKVLLNSPFLVVNNLCDKGVVEINSSLTTYAGTSNPTPPIYIEGEEVDLRNVDAWVQWQNYFTLQIPYTLRVWGRDFNVGVIVELLQSIYTDRYARIKYNQENVYNAETQAYDNYTFISLECGANNSEGVAMFPYYIESERILTSQITETTNLFIGLQQQNNLFEIDFKILN